MSSLWSTASSSSSSSSEPASILPNVNEVTPPSSGVSTPTRARSRSNTPSSAKEIEKKVESGAASLDDLLADHKEGIRKLKEELGEKMPKQWDEIWLLRYCLSFPNAVERLQAALKCIAWRETNAWMLSDAAAGNPAPSHSIISQYVTSGFHAPTIALQGNPLFIIRGGAGNPKALMDSGVSTEHLLLHAMYFREQAFQECDKQTRERRRIVKMVNVIHMEDSQFSLMDRRYFHIIGQCGRIAEFVYPQLLLRTVAVNPPSFFHAIYSIFRPLMTKKMIEKQALCPGRSTARPSASVCPFVSKYYDADSLPTFLGGKCRCLDQGGCLLCRPNEESKPPIVPHNASVTVGARTYYDVIRPAKSSKEKLHYSLEAESDCDIEVSAWLVPESGKEIKLVAPARHSVKAGEKIEGEAPVGEAGTVFLRMNNSHSWVYSYNIKPSVFCAE